MFDQLKNEIKQRNNEKSALEEAVRKKEEELASKRRAAKKSLLRKIKPIDSIKSKSEQKKDQEEVERFRAQINEEIQAARSHRNQQLVRNNIGKIVAAVSILVLAFVLLCFFVGRNSDNTTATPADEIVAAVPETEMPERTVAETPTPAPSVFKITYLDVGEGDSALIECDGHYMLIDGGSPSQSSKIYSVLKARNITHLEYIVCTHVHEDHSGGLAGALQYAEVGTAFCSATEYDARGFNSFVKYLAEQNKTITVPKVGDLFELGSATVEILGPTKVSSNDNCNSIILRITYGDTSFLFVGDAEFEEEQDVLASGASLKSTVLKIGHHGSNNSTSPEWLAAVAPEYAVISVGANNEYGHPAEQVLNLLGGANIATYRTDLQGDITCISNGKSVEFNVERNPLARTLEPQNTPTPEPTPTPIPTLEPASTDSSQADSQEDTTRAQQETPTSSYVVNVNTGKFHNPWCSSIGRMNESSKWYYQGTRDDLIAQGYSPCQRCNP